MKIVTATFVTIFLLFTVQIVKAQAVAAKPPSTGNKSDHHIPPVHPPHPHDPKPGNGPKPGKGPFENTAPPSNPTPGNGPKPGQGPWADNAAPAKSTSTQPTVSWPAVPSVPLKDVVTKKK